MSSTARPDKRPTIGIEKDRRSRGGKALAQGLAMALFSMAMLAGCGDADNVDLDLARAYGEILIAEAEQGSDTTGWDDSIREVLAETGFASINDVRLRFEKIAVEEPRYLTAQIDSTQAYLERQRAEQSQAPAAPPKQSSADVQELVGGTGE